MTPLGTGVDAASGLGATGGTAPTWDTASVPGTSGAASSAAAGLLGGDGRGEVLREGERGRLQLLRREDGLQRRGVRGLGQQPLDEEDLAPLGILGDSLAKVLTDCFHGGRRPHGHGLAEDSAQRVLVAEEDPDGPDDGEPELLLAQEGPVDGIRVVLGEGAPPVNKRQKVNNQLKRKQIAKK